MGNKFLATVYLNLIFLIHSLNQNLHFSTTGSLNIVFNFASSTLLKSDK